jgi:hypothetical protein
MKRVLAICYFSAVTCWVLTTWLSLLGEATADYILQSGVMAIVVRNIFVDTKDGPSS